MKPAVFAAVAGSLPNQGANACLHLGFPLLQIVACFCLKDSDQVGVFDKLLVLCPLDGGKRTLVAFPCQFIDSSLRHRVGTELRKPLR